MHSRTVGSRQLLLVACGCGEAMGEPKPPSTRTRALRESDGGNEGVEDKERGGGGGGGGGARTGCEAGDGRGGGEAHRAMCP